MGAPFIRLEGIGLHGGQPAAVTLVRREGPVALRVRDAEATLDELSVVGTIRAVTVQSKSGAIRVRTVDHLFAAMAGLGIRDGLRIDVEGPELPLVDGCAVEFTNALRSLGLGARGIAPAPPRLRVVRHAIYEERASRFEVWPSRPSDWALVEAPVVRVQAVFPKEAPADLVRDVEWRGDPEDFAARIATARTFAFASEIEGLLAAGLAQHVSPESVVVLQPEGALTAGRPFSPDEPARHKLLDLLGDVYLYGGPPLGELLATRPGHGATHAFVKRAIADGVLLSV